MWGPPSRPGQALAQRGPSEEGALPFAFEVFVARSDTHA